MEKKLFSSFIFKLNYSNQFYVYIPKRVSYIIYITNKYFYSKNTRKMFDYVSYFIKNIFPPFIFVSGLIGNMVGFCLLKRNKLKEIDPLSSYRYLFTMDDPIHYSHILFDSNFSLLSGLRLQQRHNRTLKFVMSSIHVCGLCTGANLSNVACLYFS